MRSFTTRSYQGFTIVEVVVVLCLVGIVAAVGYVWWQGRDKTSTDSTSNQSSTSASVASNLTPTPTPDPTADWKTYTTKRYGVTFKYPADASVVDNFDAGSSSRELTIKRSDTITLVTLNVDSPRGCVGTGEEPVYGPDFSVTLNGQQLNVKDSCLSYVQEVTLGGATKASLELGNESHPDQASDIRLIVASMQGATAR